MKDVRECAFCMKPFMPYEERGELKRYCCSNCQMRAAHARRMERAEIKQCNHCGDDYKALYKTSKYCSRQCSSSDVKRVRAKVKNFDETNKLLMMFGGGKC